MSVSLIYIIYQMQVSHDIIYVLKNAIAQTAKPEIILCEQNFVATEWLKDFCEASGIIYIYLPEPMKKSQRGNMGLLKNTCVKRVTSDYICFSDTDIIFLNENYLGTLMQYMISSSHPILVRPPMLRLYEGKQLLFDSIDRNGNFDIRIYNPENHCAVQFNGEQIEACGKEKYKFFNNLPHFTRTCKPEIWQLTYHSGGIFVKTSTLLNVGGYGMEYFGWGLDDIDLQWKLNEAVGARAVSECVPGMSVLHFEHPSRYDEILYQKNRTVFEQRRTQGLDAVIEKDVLKYGKLP